MKIIIKPIFNIEPMTEKIEDKVRNLPSDWWQHASVVQGLIKYFKSHIVGLLLGGSINKTYQYYLYTGFILNHKENFLWLTAGHVIENITAVLSSTNFSLSVIRWLDGYDVAGAESFPVNVANLRMKSWVSEGLDFGVIAFSDLEKQIISANKNISVMNEKIWKNLNKASPEGYYVIGYPRIWNIYKETPIESNKVLRSIKADLACLPLEPISPVANAEDPFWDKKNAFYGKIIKYPDLEDFRIDDIVGMSGGPILSIERTSESKFAYRLVGIQVKWKPEMKIICAEPIESIALALSKWTR